MDQCSDPQVTQSHSQLNCLYRSHYLELKDKIKKVYEAKWATY